MGQFCELIIIPLKYKRFIQREKMLDKNQSSLQELFWPFLANDMSNEITREEHFVNTDNQKKDPNAVFIEFAPNEALEKLLNLSQLENYAEKYLQFIPLSPSESSMLSILQS